MYSFEGREWEVVTEAAKDMISQMLVLDFSKRAAAKLLCQHRWFQVGSGLTATLITAAGVPPCLLLRGHQTLSVSGGRVCAYLCCTAFSPSQVAATAPAAALGAHMVKRLRAFAGMSRMKRLALVVLARTLTDNDVKRLRVRGRGCGDGVRA